MSFDENKTTKFIRSDVSLASVSSGVTGAYAITKPIRLQRVYWREAFYKGCSICSRKIANKCPRHPSSSSKAYYRMRVLLNQDDVELWVRAFDETAAALNHLGIIIFFFSPTQLNHLGSHGACLVKTI